MPSTQWLRHSRAWERTKWERRERKASGPLHILRNALLHTHVHVNTHTHTSGSASIMFTYFRRSPGTRCTTFRKLLTASARLAFLETPTEPEGGGLLSDTDQNRSDPRQEGLTCRRDSPVGVAVQQHAGRVPGSKGGEPGVVDFTTPSNRTNRVKPDQSQTSRVLRTGGHLGRWRRAARPASLLRISNVHVNRTLLPCAAPLPSWWRTGTPSACTCSPSTQ